MKSWNRHIETTNAVRRYQNGEQQVLKVLVRRFHPVLIRAIRRQAGSGAPAEDIAQECWYAIIPQLENLKLKISFEVWAIAIARRKAIDWIRQEQRNRTKNQSLETEIKSRSLDTDEEEYHAVDLKVAIRQLPATQRIVLEMFYLENLNLLEISEVLNIAQGTVKSRLFYAREKLKRFVNQ
jgi:RNA polymerase sigma-70 factor (ECF subfamily)